MNEPEWCGLCEDAPAVGRMIIVVYLTQNEVKTERPPPNMRVCARCGNAATGQLVAENYATGQVAVLQFEHDDFAKLPDDAADKLAATMESTVCSVCGEKPEVDPAVPVMELRALAEKMLRQHPDLSSVTITCASCGPACPDCDPSCGGCLGEEEHTGP